jgi:hypothetical protein
LPDTPDYNYVNEVKLPIETKKKKLSFAQFTAHSGKNKR